METKYRECISREIIIDGEREYLLSFASTQFFFGLTRLVASLLIDDRDFALFDILFARLFAR